MQIVQKTNGRIMKRVLLSSALLLVSTLTFAQSKVSGTVKDANGEPLIGVSVMEVGTNNGAVTDINGNYTLNVKPGAKLKLSYIGFTSKTIKASGNSQIVLDEDNTALNEVVVVGYGTMRRKDVTSSITTVKAEDLNQGVFTDPGQMLQGKVPGLVVSSTADPNGSPTITLRGASTLRTGAMSPYYVVDGIPGVDISIVSPEDIESIDVLRDATATAIYGSKAANGVIIITTKKGAEEKTNVSYNGYVAFDNILKKYDVCTADDLRQYAKDNNITLKDGGANTDWQDEVLRTGISHNHNVNISGGNGSTNYMISADLRKREGVIKMTGFDRFNVRSLVSTKTLKDHLTVSLGANMMYGKHFGVPSGNEGASVLDAMNYYSPTNAIKNADGTWTVGSGSKNYNPLALMEENKSETVWKRNQFVGKTALELWKGFVWSVNYSWSNYQSTYSAYNTRNSQLEGIGNKNGQATRNTYFGREQTFETYLNYDFKVGKSKWGLMGGYSWEEKKNNDGFGLSVEGYYNDDLGWYNMSYAQTILGVQNSVQSGYLEKVRNISFYGRVNYSFDSRYMLQATIRRDGSSVFGKNNRWGTFPSVSAAWNITEEKFMQNQHIFDNLKLRAGYGISGNAMGFDVYSSYNTYGASGTFVYDGKTYRTYGATKNANPDLKWESTGMLNIGLDFAFLKGRLNGTVEVYHKKTKDLIWSYPVSTTQYIYSWMDANVGEMTNKGIEFTLNAVPVRTKNFMWSTTLNLSHNKNTVDKMQNETFHTTNLTQGDPMVAGVSADGWTQRIMEGEPIGTFYTYQYAGIVNGRSEYYVLDENGNRTGETTNNPSLKDRSITGCAQPKLNAGWNNTLTYKNWSLNAFITGVFGNDVYNSARAHYTAAQMFSDGKNVLKEFLSNPVGDASGSLPSDRYIEKGSYVRLQTLSLSYTFRNCFNDWIQDLTLYGTANNLFTITNYKGLDPEVNMGGIDPGIDYRWSRYPHTRTFMVGVKINFGGSKKKKATPQYIDREVIKEVPVIKEVVKEVPGKTTFVQSTYVVTFPVNSAEIGNTSELDGIKSGSNVEIVAYASPEGKSSVNQQLSQKRADAVAKYLQNKGVNVTRIIAKGADTNHANRIAIVTVK
ncbi:SusC/RagA family TonB-linked outer membrane protein [Prevotella copri]|uniref:SusC/RagA family TonB-linked outer membrane protein n=1 Tax=Segatella copri TaxID=165179 RepID=A0A6G1TYK2_9BACT|nr:SusC/RagA family TonB-linked outer membrane protein [Segatella copri]MQN79648.1 SusC/RagA family TonB-linked outer membrane protein [Segatella copri]